MAAERAPMVSVVIPSYNCARYLPEAIDSVLAQTYRDFEIIVVDDGSTDSTPQVLARYGDRIRVIRQPNGGEASARNAGILAARGDFIAFLDADDVWLPLNLERQVSLLQARPEIGWVYCDYRWFDEQGIEERTSFQKRCIAHPPEGEMLLPVLRLYPMVTITTVVRVGCFWEVGLFDTSFPVATDTDMWIRLACRFRAACVNEALSLRRRHGQSVTSLNPPSTSKVYAYHGWRLWRKVARHSLPELAPVLRREAAHIVQCSAQAAACRLAARAWAEGDWADTCRWLLRALATTPGTSIYQAGVLLDLVLPRAVMRVARRMKGRVTRVRRAVLEHRPTEPEPDLMEGVQRERT